jgi:hypothetical protein
MGFRSYENADSAARMTKNHRVRSSLIGVFEFETEITNRNVATLR